MTDYEIYIISKSDILSSVFDVKSRDKILCFITEIDKWDWEVESVIESYAQLREVLVIAKNAKKRVSIRNPSNKLTCGLNLLISNWNNLIHLAAQEYELLSESDKEKLSDINIDFKLYKKKF